MDRDFSVSEYFKLGLKYSDIITCMDELHGCVLSISSLKRITKKIGLHRRKYITDILQVALFVLEQCEMHGQMHGYRWMHLKCLETELVVD